MAAAVHSSELVFALRAIDWWLIEPVASSVLASIGQEQQLKHLQAQP